MDAGASDVRLVRELFPFCFVLDRSMRVGMAGERWRSLAPEVVPGAPFDEVFEIERPTGVRTEAEIALHQSDIFIVALRSRPEFKLRGQFLARESCSCGGCLLFVGGPWITRVSDLSRLGLALEDFPPHDPRGDFLVLLQTHESTLADLKGLAARLRRSGAELAERSAQIEREMQRRSELEEQLRQSQKMEAVGRLAGGIAHEFNNILMAIHGYAALALSRLGAGDPVRPWATEIQKASDRAATLTRQLLAFSRQQVLRPKALDLAREIAEIEKLVRPLIGEHIALSVEVARDVGTVWADASAIQQIVMNLAVNARDAMPEGGELSVRVARREAPVSESVEPGEFLELVVRDTGVGMDETTRARIFEPFFTTKEVGKGSGLGLSTVFGLVEQCGEGGVADAPAERSGAAGGRGERVLLVEDEGLVRRLLETLLTRAGYQVVATADPREAAVRAERDRAFDLLVTDIVMAGMNGRDLARRVEDACGPVATIFMSGHTDDAGLRAGELAVHQRFLAKPFDHEVLLTGIRSLLDETRSLRRFRI
jgi:two-component system cell cycle sensor histidine kinase/response regulator CckA